VGCCEEGVHLGWDGRGGVEPAGALAPRAAAADRFKGKNGTPLDVVAPPGLDVPRLVVVGVGKARDLKAQDFVKLGGVAMGRVPSAASEATMIADLPGGAAKPGAVAALRPAPGLPANASSAT